jgi:DNA polymerase-3 subunit epsilon
MPVPPFRYFCTLALARSVWPELESHALMALAKNFDIVYNAHNALDDARTCGKLVQMSAEHLGNSKNLKALLKIAGIGINSLT